MCNHSSLQERHEEMTKHEDLQQEIREIEEHYEHIPETRSHVGTAEERKVLYACVNSLIAPRHASVS